jgi:hypothetical protein
VPLGKGERQGALAGRRRPEYREHQRLAGLAAHHDGRRRGRRAGHRVIVHSTQAAIAASSTSNPSC